jgi:hypothetical protein
VKFVSNITSHTLGKDGCLKTNVRAAPSTHLWMSFTQNQNLWSYDSTWDLSWNKFEYIRAWISFLPFVMNTLHFFPEKTKITIHLSLNPNFVSLLCHLV